MHARNFAAEAPHTYYAALRRQSTANTQTHQTNTHTPDFVVGAGVTTSTIARAAHDTFVEDRLHLNGVCRRSKWPRGLRHTSTHTHKRVHAHTHTIYTHIRKSAHAHQSQSPASLCLRVCVCVCCIIYAHTQKRTCPPVTVTRLSLSACVCVCVLYCFLLSSCFLPQLACAKLC
jgi:hypothetical protein